MVFEYPVKHNGVDYPAGTEVPVGNAPKVEEKVEPKVEVKAEEEPKPKVETKVKPKKK